MKPTLPCSLLCLVFGASAPLFATTYEIVSPSVTPTAVQIRNEEGESCTLNAGDTLNIAESLYTGISTHQVVVKPAIVVNPGESGTMISFKSAGWRHLTFNELSGSGDLTLRGNTGTTYYGSFILGGNTAFSGTITLQNVNNGRIQLDLASQGAAAGAVIDLSTSGGNTSATAVLHLSADATVAGLQGTKAAARVTSSEGGSKTLTIDVAQDKAYVYAGQIGKGNYSTYANGTSEAATGSISIVKTGAGTQALTGELALSEIEVQNGILDVSGSTGIGSQAVVIDLSGGTLKGLSLTGENRSNITFAGNQTGGTLKDLSASFDAGASGWSPYAFVAGTSIDGLSLTMSGSLTQVGETIELFTGGSMVNPDAWTLNYNGIDAVMTNGSAQIGRNVYMLVSEPGRIALSLSQMEVYDLVWNGSDGNMTWQAGTGTNMTHGGVSETYELGDNVTFGETGAGDVTISGRVGASGTLQFTGGVYTFANDSATEGSGLFGAVDLRLSGNASVRSPKRNR